MKDLIKPAKSIGGRQSKSSQRICERGCNRNFALIRIVRLEEDSMLGNPVCLFQIVSF